MLKGIIDQSSTVLSLPTGGLKMTEDEVKNLWNTYDTDGSGELSNNEIDKFIHHKGMTVTEKVTRRKYS